jgi:MFS transporter, NNP family, nitrate/nitrite transporter
MGTLRVLLPDLWRICRVYLPSLLKEQFHLMPAVAGFRTAGFVVLATLLRPVGGWLSDRIGGVPVLSAVFAVVIPFAPMLAAPSMLAFTIGVFGMRPAAGLEKGAVFKLVPQYFPTETGTVKGLVGAMGGLRSFFPPLLLGSLRDHPGTVWPAFALLAWSHWRYGWSTGKSLFPGRTKTCFAQYSFVRRVDREARG